MDISKTISEIEEDLRLTRHCLIYLKDTYTRRKPLDETGLSITARHLARRISELEYSAVQLARHLGGDEVI